MTIEYDKVKCATCGKIIHREKRLINMCANSFCNKECRQKYKKFITIPFLCEKYNKGKHFFTTNLCRPEFNKFHVSGTRHKYAFKNDPNFFKMLEFFMKNRGRYNYFEKK